MLPLYKFAEDNVPVEPALLAASFATTFPLLDIKKYVGW